MRSPARREALLSYLREHWAFLCTKGRYPGVDFLRALATFCMLLFHWDYLKVGWISIDLFFVISGFLIGGMIIDEQAAGRFSFRAFYRNRVLRIFPTYYLFIALCLFVKVLYFGTTRFNWSQAIRSIGSALLFVQTTGRYYFGWDLNLEYVPGGSWSLVVEEYFYLLLPAFIALFYLRRRAHQRALAYALVLLFAAGPLVRWLATRQFAPDDGDWYYASYVQFHSRYDELLAGVLTAIVIRRVALKRDTRQLCFVLGSVLILGVILYLDLTPAFFVRPYLMTRPTLVFPTLVGAGFALWVLALFDMNVHSRLVVAFARLSYPTYLGHIFVTEVIRLLILRQPITSHYNRPLGNLNVLTFFLPTLVLSYVISLSVEYRFIRLYKKPRPRLVVPTPELQRDSPLVPNR